MFVTHSRQSVDLPMRMPQISVMRPGTEIDFGDKRGSNAHQPLALDRHRWFIDPHGIKQSAQISRQLCRKTCPNVAHIDQLVTFFRRQQQACD